MTEFFTTPDGLRLAYNDTGHGHPLLCLAGLSRNMDDFAPVVAHFASRARVLRLDSRGRGRSDRDPDFHNYSVLQEARDVVALLDHLGLEKVSILGTSRGGLIAMSLAMVNPERLHGVIFNDIGPVVDPAGLADIMGYLGYKPSYSSFEDAADRLPEAMAPRFSNVPRATWQAFAEALWFETPQGLDIRYDPALRRAVLEQAAEGALPEIWPLFEALAPFPVALIRGENSNILTRETAEEMRRRKPDLIFAEVPDRGHVPFLDEPESRAVISAYLESVT
ncbi:alpha/beta fold hydrolase [Aliiruegeria lutimaris]|uniref:Pimeloyl-ACP methyl ester carboxylesterase n=1 Tax=Aliiruegeria lutimaris TaxID=571298 RepID=A0A1G9H053_9RHOB|nr:alpha/beta hydrolase [Aliiruegeria lutimaris]SDL06340.1 Pimeloyl-ACP methyl ester carboxylesterase [Aliiruegeria lutimaris]